MFRPVRLIRLLLLGLLLVGCQGVQRQSLTFETIQQSSRSRWESLESGLIIITNQAEITQVEPLIEEQEVHEALSHIDFTSSFVIIAFRGQQSDIHSGFQIDHIIRQGQDIVLQAQPGQLGGQPVITSPYHLIKVRKEGDWGKELTFHLYFGEDQPAVVSVSHFVE